MTRLLKLICAGLAILLLVQVSGLTARKDPLAGLKLPPLAPAPVTPATPEKKTTNAPPRVEPPGKENPSPLIQGRLDRIVQSEILGQVMRPLPMALLGIAGPDVFLRAPNGQTGLVREGGELGGVKLLRIGTNRILIEHEGQKKELMIFSGFGSETLLQKGKETPK